jgi:hypothetical protein
MWSEYENFANKQEFKTNVSLINSIQVQVIPELEFIIVKGVFSE